VVEILIEIKPPIELSAKRNMPGCSITELPKRKSVCSNLGTRKVNVRMIMIHMYYTYVLE